MCSCGCGSCSCRCGCRCGSSCGGCSCGCGSNNGITTLPAFPDTPAFPGLTDSLNLRFPVYVSYPAFFPADSAINDANIALFTRGSGSDSGCGCG